MLRRTFLSITTATLLASPAFAEGHAKDIVDTAVEAGSSRHWSPPFEAAGLVETLKGEGPFTVFAPTDDAFAALPEGTVEDLLKPENKDKLTAILTYHVVPGKVMSDGPLQRHEGRYRRRQRSHDHDRRRRDGERRQRRPPPTSKPRTA